MEPSTLNPIYHNGTLNPKPYIFGNSQIGTSPAPQSRVFDLRQLKAHWALSAWRLKKPWFGVSRGFL